VKTIERAWDWWAYHYRVVHRAQIPGISQWDDDLVELIVHVLELKPGDRVLVPYDRDHYGNLVIVGQKG
jgi:hypothetical protein